MYTPSVMDCKLRVPATKLCL